VSDLFAERFAAVRQRFAAKLSSRIDEIEATVPELDREGSTETLARAHRRAHDLCGVGPTMGFVETGRAARSIEQVLLAAVKAGRALSAGEVGHVRDGIALLRSAASAETASVAQEPR
jgi:chemotaxis protein histidine kinase CheA